MEFHDTVPIYNTTRKFIEIPEGISSIPEYHFQDYIELSYIKFPSTIRHIGNCAFNGCISLRMVYFPCGLLTIGVG